MNYYNQETERLFLRKMTKNDIEKWMPFFDENPLEQYLGIDMSLPTETKSKNWIEMQLKRYENNDFGHLAAIDKISGKLIGVGGLIPRKINSAKELEIAYSIIPKYWNFGYATEIAKQMKRYAKQHQLSNSIISIIHIENITSQKVAIKNGMSKEIRTIFKGMDVYVFRTKIKFLKKNDCSFYFYFIYFTANFDIIFSSFKHIYR